MLTSVPQHAFEAKQVLENERIIAKQESIDMYALMEQAGAAVFQQVETLSLTKKSLLIVCGKGNNGGDGLVVSRLALQAGYQVTTLLVSESSLTCNELYQADALRALVALQVNNGKVISISSVQQLNSIISTQTYAVVIDALFGIGFRGQLSSLFQGIIQSLNTLDGKKIAIDVPSGVNATSGHIDSVAFNAETTISFIAAKQGLYTGQAVNYTGEVIHASLGLHKAFVEFVNTEVFIQRMDNLPLFTKRKKTTHKGHIGLLLAIGGNKGMPGAIALASTAALKTGAALVSVASHKNSQLIVHSNQPELMIAGTDVEDIEKNAMLEKTKMLLIGPGLGLDTWAVSLFNHALTFRDKEKLMVLDADALTLLSQTQHFYQHWVLTPHPGEAARLLNCQVADIEKDRFAAVRQIAKRYGGICVLKGAGSLVSDGAQCWINSSGNPSMASGGMGDVLSGIIAALLMQMNDKLAAVRLATFIHGFIADELVEKQGPIGLLASDIINHIPEKLNKII